MTEGQAAFDVAGQADRAVPGTPGCDLVAGATFLLLLQTVSCQLLAGLAPAKASPQLSRLQLRVARALGFIEKEIGRPLGLDDVARHLGMNAAYLAQIFRRETGRSVVQHLIQRRMAVAVERLCNTNLSIKEIARSVGYNTPLHFSRQFRRAMGLAPTEFRSLPAWSGRPPFWRVDFLAGGALCRTMTPSFPGTGPSASAPPF